MIVQNVYRKKRGITTGISLVASCLPRAQLSVGTCASWTKSMTCQFPFWRVFDKTTMVEKVWENEWKSSQGCKSAFLVLFLSFLIPSLSQYHTHTSPFSKAGVHTDFLINPLALSVQKRAAFRSNQGKSLDSIYKQSA